MPSMLPLALPLLLKKLMPPPLLLPSFTWPLSLDFEAPDLQ
uniref:Uncharacterized protein n=1 Tax=Picea glauca TaxID=3330 RepID=A0A101M2V5_PICGL|nr:hypothetical protein ABT39_MTgene3269 [Picea glauca]QHR89226.1 hypothetical protein Q903MT_gene3246 [Picea sitchensis]